MELKPITPADVTAARLVLIVPSGIETDSHLSHRSCKQVLIVPSGIETLVRSWLLGRLIRINCT